MKSHKDTAGQVRRFLCDCKHILFFHSLTAQKYKIFVLSLKQLSAKKKKNYLCSSFSDSNCISEV